MGTKVFGSIITKHTAPYFFSVLLLPQVVNSNVAPRLMEINEKSRQAYAKQVLGKEYRSLAQLKEDWIVLEKFILDKVNRALPRHSVYYRYAIANAIISESNKFGFDPLFILAIIEQESSIQPSMRGAAGEIGLMQLMPKTASWIAKKYKLKYTSRKQLFDPVFNIKIGVRYLSYLHQKFPRAHYSIAAYNMGPKNVNKLLRKDKKPEVYFAHVMRRYKRFYAQSNVQDHTLRQSTVLASAE